ncbi:hydroxymethylbilane synthase, partial [Pandoraea pneumonica]
MSSNARPTSVESQLATTPAAQAPTKLVIASRESRLALWQAEHVRAA